MVFGMPEDKGEDIDKLSSVFSSQKETEFKKPLSLDEQIDDLKKKIKDAVGNDKNLFARELKRLSSRRTALGMGPKQRKRNEGIVAQFLAEQKAERDKAAEDLAKIPKLSPGQKPRSDTTVSPDRLTQLRNEARAKSGLPALSFLRPKPKESNSDKLAAKVLADLNKSNAPKFPSTRFNFPEFTAENSTTIIIGCFAIIAILELSLGTKFVQLWNYSFSPKTDIMGATTIVGGTNQIGNQTGPAPLNLNPLGKALGPGSLPDSWGIPSQFDYIEGAIF
jgi:hypothetical protein